MANLMQKTYIFVFRNFEKNRKDFFSPIDIRETRLVKLTDQISIFVFKDHFVKQTRGLLVFRFLSQGIETSNDRLEDRRDQVLNEVRRFVVNISERYGVNINALHFYLHSNDTLTLIFEGPLGFTVGRFLPAVYASIHKFLLSDFLLVDKNVYRDGLHSSCYIPGKPYPGGMSKKIDWDTLNTLTGQEWHNYMVRMSNESNRPPQNLGSPINQYIQPVLYIDQRFLRLFVEHLEQVFVALIAGEAISGVDKTGLEHRTLFPNAVKKCTALYNILTSRQPNKKILQRVSEWKIVLRFCRAFGVFGEQIASMFCVLKLTDLKFTDAASKLAGFTKQNLAPVSCKEMCKKGFCTNDCGVLHPAELAYEFLAPPDVFSGVHTTSPQKNCRQKLEKWLRTKYVKPHIYARDIHRQYYKTHSLEDILTATEGVIQIGLLVPVTPDYLRPRGKPPSQLYFINR